MRLTWWYLPSVSVSFKWVSDTFSQAAALTGLGLSSNTTPANNFSTFFNSKNIIISNTLFEGNKSSNFGGAVYINSNWENASLNFYECIFNENRDFRLGNEIWIKAIVDNPNQNFEIYFNKTKFINWFNNLDTTNLIFIKTN
jgi:predicted outer membrane repeat protein